jgi:hypothetical protein
MPRSGFKFVLVVGNRVLTPIAERTRRDRFRTTERQRSFVDLQNALGRGRRAMCERATARRCG